MRCIICDIYQSDGPLNDLCETCAAVIRNSLYNNSLALAEDYSVIPSETDHFGRVIKGKYIE